jgi:hypothetical protein
MRKTNFGAKNQFLAIYQFPLEVSILEYMLPHNSYMNMAIVNILHYQSSLYDHQGPRDTNFDTLKTNEWAWPIFEGSNMEFEFGHKIFSQLFGTTNRSILCRIINGTTSDKVEVKIIWVQNEAKIAEERNFCFMGNLQNFCLHSFFEMASIILRKIDLNVVPNIREKILRPNSMLEPSKMGHAPSWVLKVSKFMFLGHWWLQRLD